MSAPTLPAPLASLLRSSVVLIAASLGSVSATVALSPLVTGLIGKVDQGSR
jgi:hypothetical protein